MLNIRSYAATICTYALAIKIALDQPHYISGMNIVDLAISILDKVATIANKEKLKKSIQSILQHNTPHIDSHYSIQLVDVLWRDSDSATDHTPSDNIANILAAILKSTDATIHKINADYLEMDDVFFDKDHSVWLNACSASVKATEAKHKVQNAWRAMPNHGFSAEPLQQTVIQARDTAKSASDAYHNFAKYFDQFRPTIQKLLEDCSTLFAPEIKKKLDSCDNVVDLTADDRTVQLGVDLKAVQDALDYLNKYIGQAYNTLQHALDKLKLAIKEAHKTAHTYQSAYHQYKKLIRSINHVINILI